LLQTVRVDVALICHALSLENMHSATYRAAWRVMAVIQGCWLWYRLKARIRLRIQCSVVTYVISCTVLAIRQS